MYFVQKDYILHKINPKLKFGSCWSACACGEPYHSSHHLIAQKFSTHRVQALKQNPSYIKPTKFFTYLLRETWENTLY